MDKTAENNNGNGRNNFSQKEIEDLLQSVKDNPIDNAFKYSDGNFNAAKAMIELKEKLGENALLLDIPNKRFAVAVKYAWYQYCKHHQEERKAALMIQLGLLASIGGKRVREFSETIIGERKNHREDHGNGLLEKLNKFNGDTK